MTQPPFGNPPPPFGYQPSQYQYPPQEQHQQYPPQYTPQQHYQQYPPQPAVQHQSTRSHRVPKPKTPATPKFSFTDLKTLPWICENCNRYFTDVFEAGSHEMVTSHDKGREMTEKEVLEKREEEKRVELEVLRGKVMGPSQAPGTLGAKMPTYTPSTIPGLGPVSNGAGLAPLPMPTPQSSNESELNRSRRENASLKLQIKELKTKVVPRIDALAEDLKSLHSKTKEHELQIHYVTQERDQLKAEVDALRGVEATGGQHEEIDLDMDFV